MKDLIFGATCALIGLVAGLAAASPSSQSVPKVHTHIDKDVNIVCMTYRVTMQCFPYVDEGKALSYPEPKLAL